MYYLLQGMDVLDRHFPLYPMLFTASSGRIVWFLRVFELEDDGTCEIMMRRLEHASKKKENERDILKKNVDSLQSDKIQSETSLLLPVEHAHMLFQQERIIITLKHFKRNC